MNLEDWKKANPGKSLNEYYAYVRNNGITEVSGSRKSSRPTPNIQTQNAADNNQNWIKHIIFGLLLPVLIATNPNESQHYDNAVNVMSSQLKKEAGDWGVLEGLKNMGSAYLTKVTITVDHRRNFLLFSIQDVNLAGIKVGVSIGFVGLNYIIWDE